MRNALQESKTLAFIILLVYLSVSFIFIKPLEALGPYAQNIFEATFVLIVISLYKSDLRLKLKLNKNLLFQFGASVLFGFFIYRFAGFENIVIPFDLSSHETLLFLLFLGPIIEELVFRQALWSSIHVLVSPKPLKADSTKNPQQTGWAKLFPFGLTSIIFAFAHFFSFFFLPKEFQPFIIYQTCYVMIIGLWWGYNLLKKGSITATILLHMAFNFGFYLGFRFV